MTPWLSAYKESRGIVLPDNSVLMEYFFEGEAAVSSRKYTPNEVTYSWNANTPGIVSFGIGYDEGWYDTGGYKLFDNQGLLSTRFKAGYNSITMKYIPPKFYIGLILTLLAVALILLIYIYPNFAKRLKPIFD